MSNRVSIDPTVFVNDRSGDKTFGFRIYDDYNKAYDNNWESIPTDDFDIIKKILESDDEIIRGIMSFVQEFKKGIDVDGTFYDWDEIKSCFGD